MRISRKMFWILALTYSAAVLLLNNVFHTALGEFLMQLSYFALAFVIVSFVYKIMKFSIRQFMYDRKKKKKEEES